MSNRRDKVRDVIAVLTLMRDEFKRTSSYRSPSELRIEAVKSIAESELRAKRYKNEDSAQKTIHDACGRRLRPDVKSIKDFDEIAGRWLSENSMNLKNILLKHSQGRSQDTEVNDFFTAEK